LSKLRISVEAIEKEADELDSVVRLMQEDRPSLEKLLADWNATKRDLEAQQLQLVKVGIISMMSTEVSTGSADETSSGRHWRGRPRPAH
jgi:hypothetical protein